ncbi:unnamed protein product [Prorocentrum cordatum]|uniref:Uncharacterized protein n=1 Tax=Prorocentrum cordatum TaxID=2364126 RepID=A0ABN9XA01_9DINO|nr:unnamed protein product [Polarella glacialis]
MDGGGTHVSMPTALALNTSNIYLRFISFFICWLMELKWFCERGSRKTVRESTDRTESEALVQRFTNILPISIATMLSPGHLQGFRRHKFSPEVTPGFIDDSSSVSKDVVTDPSRHHNGKVVYTTVQRPPSAEKIFAAWGKALAILRHSLSSAGCSAECTWEPDWQFTVTSGQVLATVGTVDASVAIWWDSATCWQHLGKPAAEVQRAFLVFTD